MKLTVRTMRSLVCLVLVTHDAASAQSADEIVKKARDTYAQLHAYADTGVVLDQYGTSSEDKHTFSTRFVRTPRHVLLDFHKQGGDRYVIWADPDAFHTWWKTTGQQTDYPNPNNTPAITLSGPPTASSSIRVIPPVRATASNTRRTSDARPAARASSALSTVSGKIKF